MVMATVVVDRVRCSIVGHPAVPHHHVADRLGLLAARCPTDPCVCNPVFGQLFGGVR